jgi:mono/diheme cytochrome c family protein
MKLNRATLALCALTLSGLSLGLVGCGGGGGGGGASGGGAGSSGGEVSYAGPIASTDVALGQQRYDSRCGNSCHNSGGGPALANIGWTAERTRRQIREGSGGMAPIGASRLSNEDMEAVLAYLVTIGAVVDEGAGGAAPAETTSAEAAPAQ